MVPRTAAVGIPHRDCSCKAVVGAPAVDGQLLVPRRDGGRRLDRPLQRLDLRAYVETLETNDNDDVACTSL